MKNQRPDKRPESEARVVITVMLVITFILAGVVATTDVIDVRVKSIILIGWIGVMLGILRQYRL